jgi:type IV secretion system protein VirD4
VSWPASLVVNDLKAELWYMTAGWRGREAGNRVIRFDPAAESGSSGFNPLEEIRLGTIHEVGDVQNLVTTLVDPEGKGLVDHWAKTSHAFLTGAILQVLYQAKAEGRSGTLPDVALALSNPSRPIDGFYRDMLHNKWLDGAIHPTIAAASRDMTNRPDEERGSVLSTAMSFLSLYRDPLIAKNVLHSDFRILDLMNAEKPVSLYLVVRAEDKDRMKPLMRLIINQLMRVLLRPEITFKDGRPIAPHKHRLLLMLDEFPSYGKLDVFQEALAYIAGYGIKAYLIMQDIAQLWGRLWTRREYHLELPHPMRLRAQQDRDRRLAVADGRHHHHRQGGHHHQRQSLRRHPLACLEDFSSDCPCPDHARRSDAAEVAGSIRRLGRAFWRS